MRTATDAYAAALRADLPDLVAEMLRALGPTAIQAMTGTRDRSVPARWVRPDGPTPKRTSQEQLRLGYRVWLMMRDSEGSQVAAAWMTGANPRLAEDTPLTAIRELRAADVVGAAEAFIADIYAA
jgi:hypothetical protein